MTRYGTEARALWPLDPEIVYLNHGGYGVTPHAILAEQSAWRARIEANPTRFMTRVYPTAVREAAAALAAFVGTAAGDLVFVENATSGCNAVLRSLAFKPGDEILIANLAYGAVTKAARYVAANSGAKLATVDLPVPLDGEAAAVDAIAAGLSPRTKLVILDHIVSATGVVLPVRRMADLAHAAGARVLIDGAHAPGNIPLDVRGCGADWYVGNCHKWLFAPRACGFLWSAPDARDLIHPLAISHGYGAGMLAEFDWTGTRDPSGMLSVPAAIAFHEKLGGPALMARNAALAVETAQGFARAWGTNLSAPPSMFCSMATVRLPPRLGTSEADAAALRRKLSDGFHIETIVIPHADSLWLRIAAQAYNSAEDYPQLAAAIDRIMCD